VGITALLDRGSDRNAELAEIGLIKNVKQFSESDWIFTRHFCPLVTVIQSKNIVMVCFFPE
jgi:hypothetical protein